MRGDRVVATDPALLAEAADLAAARRPFVLATVVEASGSAPGRPGAKMVVTADGFTGTVGGGRVEKTALERARELLGSPAGPEIIRYDVVQDLGMTCGGSMKILFEPMTPPARLVIFGAGHVAQPLAAVAALAGFEVTVCDEREEWLTEERFPDARERILAPWDEAVERAALDEQTFAVCVSPGHTVDQQIAGGILGRSPEPRYLGVIGSRRKGEVLRRTLAEAGVGADRIERLRIPIGLNIGAAEPREIAIAVVAELIATLRGLDRVESW